MSIADDFSIVRDAIPVEPLADPIDDMRSEALDRIAAAYNQAVFELDRARAARDVAETRYARGMKDLAETDEETWQDILDRDENEDTKAAMVIDANGTFHLFGRIKFGYGPNSIDDDGMPPSLCMMCGAKHHGDRNEWCEACKADGKG